MSFQLDTAVARIQNDNRVHREQCARRRERAQEKARHFAVVLAKADPALIRIWGFGSAFEKNRPFGVDSDVDLALEGGDCFRLQTLVEDSEFVVELVDITGSDDPFATQIRQNGVLLGPVR